MRLSTNTSATTATSGLVRMKFGVFTSLKPCDGRIAELQKRSLANWASAFCGAKTVGFEGMLIPFGEMVKSVERELDANVLLYANADLLFVKSQMVAFCSLFETGVPKEMSGDFLMTGQRVDILEDGSRRLHRPSGMDYFLFRRGMFSDLPKVIMGRAYCDNSLVAYCLRRNIPVIDASFALRVEHQFHDYGHIGGGREAVWKGEDAMSNKRENQLRDFGPNVLDATHTVLPDLRVVPNIRKRPKCWAIWNLLTRGGKYWKNPKWDGVAAI